MKIKADKYTDDFVQIAETVVAYKLRAAWLEMSKMYNTIAGAHGATMSMGFTLLAIYEPEGTPVTQIAPRMGMEPNSLSRILKELENRGAIYKRKDEIDKRKVYICLTDHGKEIRKVAFKAVFNLNNELIKDISPEKLQIFFEVIDKVMDTVGNFK